MEKLLISLLFIACLFSCNKGNEEFRTVTELPESWLTLSETTIDSTTEYHLSSLDRNVVFTTTRGTGGDTCDVVAIGVTVRWTNQVVGFSFLNKALDNEVNRNEFILKSPDRILDIFDDEFHQTIPDNFCEFDQLDKSIFSFQMVSYNSLFKFGLRDIQIEVVNKEVVYFDDLAYILLKIKFSNEAVLALFQELQDDFLSYEGEFSHPLRIPELDK